ncbi:MAG TPA: L,D-transpeptidase [Propionibacteriaceae bacterium]|nr:L,D-transpeptidase [Propionibacteriaceae bacterium]
MKEARPGRLTGRLLSVAATTALTGALAFAGTTSAEATSMSAQSLAPTAVAAVQPGARAAAAPAEVTLDDLDASCDAKGRVLCISKNTDKLHYLKDREVVKTMDARFGCASMKTRQGTFKITRKSRHHVSSIYGSKMPYAMFFSGGQAVHYSADFAARGYRGCSHGCVNIRDREGIAWLFDQMKVGDRVVVYKH